MAKNKNAEKKYCYKWVALKIMFNDDVDATVFSQVIFMNNIWHGLVYSIGWVWNKKNILLLIKHTAYVWTLFLATKTELFMDDGETSDALNN